MKVSYLIAEDQDQGYDAWLFATDTDFLENSNIRKIFRDNAVVSEDAALFSMPEVKGSPRSRLAPELIEPEEDMVLALNPFGPRDKWRCKVVFIILLAGLATLIALFLTRVPSGNVPLKV